MKVSIKKTVEVEVKTLQVSAGARYWEDATVNGVEDVDGTLIPFRVGDYWQPKIDVETGSIIDWPIGTTADIHYKVCDDGQYTLLDAENNPIAATDGYVPSCMCPKENGYGDYVIMDIDENGNIADWSADFQDIIDDNEE